MIEIKKSAPNDELVQIQKEAVQKNYNADDAYELLRNPLKACVIEQLMADQGHLCAYCMRKIPDERKGLPHVKIEHWYPRNGINGETCGAEGALDYNNMLAVCSGNQNDKSRGKNNKLTCDASRGNKSLKVNPLDKSTLATIYYKDDGIIAAYDLDINMEINDYLNLNCIRETVQLPQQRKKVLMEVQNVLEEFINNGMDPLESCNILLEGLLSEKDYKRPYVGISIWWLEDFKKSLQSTY